MTSIKENNQSSMDKYDQWLKEFFKCYDKLEQYVIAKRVKYDNTLNLRIRVFKDKLHDNDENSEIYGIRLDMADNHNSFIEGPSIVLDKSEKELFKYLLLNIFCYYINKNYRGKISNDWGGILYDDHEEKRRNKKRKSRNPDSFAVMVLGLSVEPKKVGVWRAYFDARLCYDKEGFQTELDALVQRHNYDINSISDISYELKSKFLNADKPVCLDEDKLEKSKEKAVKIMELLVNNNRENNYHSSDNKKG